MTSETVHRTAEVFDWVYRLACGAVCGALLGWIAARFT